MSKLVLTYYKTLIFTLAFLIKIFGTNRPVSAFPIWLGRFPCPYF